MQYIAAYGDDQIFDLAFGAADSESVKKCLCWMFMRAITGVDDRTADFLREQGARLPRRDG